MLKYNLDEGGLSRAEISRISHDAMGQNYAKWLISRSYLSKMSLPSSFLRISSQPAEDYRRRRIVLRLFCSGLIKKTGEKDFEELVCQVNLCPCTCLFSMKLKIIGKFCFIILRANDHFWLYRVFLHCLVCHSYSYSWIFTPDVQKCDLK